MNRIELKKILDDMGVDERIYSLNGSILRDEAFCIEDNGYGRDWKVFFVERGIAYDMKTVSNEEEACEELLRRLKK